MKQVENGRFVVKVSLLVRFNALFWASCRFQSTANCKDDFSENEPCPPFLFSHTLFWTTDRFLSLPLLAETRDNGKLILHEAEIEEVFRRLFLDCEEIYIERLVSSHLAGCLLLIVSAFTGQKEEQHLILCGQRDILETADSNFIQSVPKGKPYHFVKSNRAETTHYKAVMCELPGVANLNDVETLAQFFQHGSVKQVAKIIHYLFGEILYTWYQEQRYWDKEAGLAPLVKRWLGGSIEETVMALKPLFASICEQTLSLGSVLLDCSDQWLTLQLSQRGEIILPNPLTVLREGYLETAEPVLYGTAHGQLGKTAVLVDNLENCWLVDYAHVNRGPLLQDFLMLETAVKYDMFHSSNFQERYEVENRLLAFWNLAQPTANENLSPEATKVLEVICLIREQAAAIGINPRHYQMGLVYHTLSRLQACDPTIRHTRRELMPYLHALVSTALLTQHLMPSQPELPLQAFHGLWIDQEKKHVWVNGQTRELTPQEFDLLDYLYQHAGETCSRDMIMKDVFKIEYDPKWTSKQIKDYNDPRINSAINRLRKKIEEDSKKPKYILAAWGKGYRLNINPAGD